MRILFIEDDRHVRIATREYLKVLFEKVRHIPLEIVEAENGQDGLDALAAGKFDVIILDAKMPVMTGDEFLEKYEGSTPIIFSSAFHTKEVGGKIAALAEKPYDCEELANTIQRLAQGS